MPIFAFEVSANSERYRGTHEAHQAGLNLPNESDLPVDLRGHG